MKYTGRIFAVSAILSVHTLYSIYYYYRDGTLDLVDLLGYPLLMALAYWSGKQFDKSKYYSENDILTGLYNRRYVMKKFSRYLLLSDRKNSNLFLLIIDCDNFKEINDKYGHQTGDEVLTNIATILKHATKKQDIVARWGGDEFLILGHYKEESELPTLLQNIHTEIKAYSRKKAFEVGISIGATIYPDDAKNIDDIITNADQKMYQQKQQRKQGDGSAS
ncbi:GGDEF domain-containing protein [Metabacillus malikii]|uniref:Diguanylate cyclase (GGDEF)-like protein n=1 Tax=Metabacillus malikii TaxID=1504265 RepID=A0ABT9ZMC3_9BACI|nr:GGDEF domain-containing protein [Metabacillus malikii]MDQ0232668.1 diguanylate cyclase (GGDEF)-like protein [Metabacillus malikii]